MNIYRAGIFLLPAIVLLMISSCAHLRTEPCSEKALLKRINKEWESKINHDWEAVYNLFTDGVKKKINKNSFIRGANVNVQLFSVEDITIDESCAKATARIKYRLKQRGFDFDFTTKEKWLKENGEWFLEHHIGFPVSK